jgi:hypothetical protein
MSRDDRCIIILGKHRENQTVILDTGYPGLSLLLPMRVNATFRTVEEMTLSHSPEVIEIVIATIGCRVVFLINEVSLEIDEPSLCY